MKSDAFFLMFCVTIMIFVIASPVSADKTPAGTPPLTITPHAPMTNPTNTTVAVNSTTSEMPTAGTTVSVSPTTESLANTTLTVNSTTSEIPLAGTTVPVSPIPSAAPATLSGNVTVYSSPLGASILIDGVFYGTTPANLTGVPQGNHIIRLTQTGFYDYEGTLYVVPGQTSHAFGTLIPLNQVTAAATAVPIIVPVVTVAPTDTPAKGLLENSSVIVAIIGVITASIAAAATIFTHVKPPKKE
jgi:hypothetical protein